MMMMQGVALGHYIYVVGIQVYPTKIEVILMLSTSHTKTKLRNLLGYDCYYHHIIAHFSKLAENLYVLTGNVKSNGLTNAMFLLQILRNWSQQPLCYVGQIGVFHFIF